MERSASRVHLQQDLMANFVSLWISNFWCRTAMVTESYAN